MATDRPTKKSSAAKAELKKPAATKTSPKKTAKAPGPTPTKTTAKKSSAKKPVPKKRAVKKSVAHVDDGIQPVEAVDAVHEESTEEAAPAVREAVAALLVAISNDLDTIATRLLDADAGRARALADALERQLTVAPLERLSRVWGLTSAQAAEVFGVSRQAYAKWLHRGVPVDRAQAVAALDELSEVLTRYVKLERIPAVVRKPAELLGNTSLLELARRDPAQALELARMMFELRRVQP